ncbi:MAG TPA: helix-turn-helix transcriptional regulator [Candidatus Saccharimonadales bacterium]|nr:helix-turn-helix transcriptional regulator [Candidatus Saccharimonadales bacterium]
MNRSGKGILQREREVLAYSKKEKTGTKTHKVSILKNDDYIPFKVENYVDNPVALARINAGITQEELAKRMKVTQAYISKLEAQDKVTAKVVKKVKDAIEK